MEPYETGYFGNVASGFCKRQDSLLSESDTWDSSSYETSDSGTMSYCLEQTDDMIAFLHKVVDGLKLRTTPLPAEQISTEVTKFIERGANPDAICNSPVLHIAAKLGDLTLVKLLISKGAKFQFCLEI